MCKSECPLRETAPLLIELASDCKDEGDEHSKYPSPGVLPDLLIDLGMGLMISRAAKTQPPYANRTSESPVKLPVTKTFGATSSVLSTRGRRVRPDIRALLIGFSSNP